MGASSTGIVPKGIEDVGTRHLEHNHILES